MTSRALAVVVLVAACSGRTTTQPLYAAGDPRDDGHGLLGRASTRLLIGSNDEPTIPDRTVDDDDDDELDGELGGEGYGGDEFGGGTYGGATYASYVVPAWGFPTANRVPTYSQRPGLTGSIAGTITWRGKAPTLRTACGAVDPLQLGARSTPRGTAPIADVLVYIERVSVGRVLPHSDGEQRPSTVGGVVVKRGCSLRPSVQVVTPVPAALAVHGDAARATIRIAAPGDALKTAELYEGGRVMVQAKAGVTRIDSPDGRLGAAWVIGVDSPSYAVTDEDGRYRIDEVAPGTYVVSIWQPPVPTIENRALVYGPPTIIRRTVTVGRSKPAQLDVVLGR